MQDWVKNEMNLGIPGIIFIISSGIAICFFIFFSVSLKKRYNVALVSYRDLIKLFLYNSILFLFIILIGFFCIIQLQTPFTWMDVISYNTIWLLSALIIFYESHRRERARGWAAIPGLLALTLPEFIILDLLNYQSLGFFPMPTLLALIIFIGPLTEFTGYLCELNSINTNSAFQRKEAWYGQQISDSGLFLLLFSPFFPLSITIIVVLMIIGFNLVFSGFYLVMKYRYQEPPRNRTYLRHALHPNTRTTKNSNELEINRPNSSVIKNSLDILKQHFDKEPILYTIPLLSKTIFNDQNPTFSTVSNGNRVFIDRCSVCRMVISESEEIIHCPYCNAIAHKSHLLEWLKIKGACPICNTPCNTIDISIEH